MRNLTPQLAAEMAGTSIMPILLAQLFFDSATVGMWTGYGTLTWDGDEYLGGGDFIGISPIQETQALEAKGAVVSLNGIDSALLSGALSEKTRYRPFRLYAGAVQPYTDSAGNPQVEIIQDPYPIFAGLMNVFEYSDDGTKADIRLSVESTLITGQRSKVRRYTPEDQKRVYPSDLGLDFINQLQDKEVVW